MITLGYEIRKHGHVHNNRGIIRGRNEFITPSSIHNCNTKENLTIINKQFVFVS
jgi:hypothetical protein